MNANVKVKKQVSTCDVPSLIISTCMRRRPTMKADPWQYTVGPHNTGQSLLSYTTLILDQLAYI